MSEDAPRHNDIITTVPRPSYRVHFLDPDGRVLRVKSLEASSDDEAVELTKRLMDGRALDLWDGLRFVEFFPTVHEADEP